MKYYTHLILKITILLIGINCFSQEKKTWIEHSNDSIVSVKHYYDGASQQLDSLVFKYEGEKIRLVEYKKNIKKEFILKYKDSLSMPFDIALPTITHITNLNASTFIAIGNNMGVEKIHSNYLNILIIDKSTYKINQWITALVPRGSFKSVFLVDEQKKIIKLPREENHILENKVYTLDYKREKYKEVVFDNHIKYFNNTKTKNLKNFQTVFTICY